MKKLLSVFLSLLLAFSLLVGARAESALTVVVTLTPEAAKAAVQSILAAAPKDFGVPEVAEVRFYVAEDGAPAGMSFAVFLVLRFIGLEENPSRVEEVRARLSSLPFVAQAEISEEEAEYGRFALLRLTPEASEKLQPFTTKDFALRGLTEVRLLEATNGEVLSGEEEYAAAVSLRFAGLRPSEVPGLLEEIKALPNVASAEVPPSVLVTVAPEFSNSERFPKKEDFGLEEILAVDPIFVDLGNQSKNFCGVCFLRLTDESEETVSRVIEAVKALPFVRSASRDEHLELLSVDPSPAGLTDLHLLTGDADRDGEVTAGDARLVLRAAVGLEQPDGAVKTAMDADFDQKITAADARLVLRAAVGLERLVTRIEVPENSTVTLGPVCEHTDGGFRVDLLPPEAGAPVDIEETRYTPDVPPNYAGTSTLCYFHLSAPARECRLTLQEKRPWEDEALWTSQIVVDKAAQ